MFYRPLPRLRSHSTRAIVGAAFLTIAILLVVTGSTIAISSAFDGRRCPQVEFVGVRGSGEPEGMGRTIDAVYSEFDKIVRARHASHALKYPASKIPILFNGVLPNDFGESIDVGVKNLNNYIILRSAECRKTKFVLAGYSQGAVVVDRAVMQLPNLFVDDVAGIVLLGDPRFDPKFENNVGSKSDDEGFARGLFWGDDTKYLSPPFDKRARSYCIDGDPICNDSFINLAKCGFDGDSCKHFQYVKERYSAHAAQFLAEQVD